MKKLVYILVAVFTMVSVNAFGIELRFHFCYPGGNETTDAVVNDIAFLYIQNYDEEKYGYYADESYSEIYYFSEHAPFCEGYTFDGYYYNYNVFGTIYPIKVITGGGSLSDISITSPNFFKNWSGDYCDLYAHWVKDKSNYRWTDDGSGFYYDWGDDRNIFLPWNHMFIGSSTDINEVEASNEVKSNKAEGIYTLNGVKVNEITKSGIYIINGKKVVK